MSTDVVLGASIGERRSSSALAVLELQEEPIHPKGHIEKIGAGLMTVTQRRRCVHLEDHWSARFLQRFPAGTAHPTLVKHLAAVYGGLSERNVTVSVIVDVTVVGQPVLDLLAKAGVRSTAAIFVSGERCSRAGRELRLGKEWLASRLQVLLQDGRLHLPSTAEARQLAEDLLAFEPKGESLTEVYGSVKVGRHDDYVCAVGVACAEEPRHFRAF